MNVASRTLLVRRDFCRDREVTTFLKKGWTLCLPVRSPQGEGGPGSTNFSQERSDWVKNSCWGSWTMRSPAPNGAWLVYIAPLERILRSFRMERCNHRVFCYPFHSRMEGVGIQKYADKYYHKRTSRTSKFFPTTDKNKG